MKYINGGSAFEANKALGRKGSFWQIEPYDRLVRDENEYFNTLRYIVDNPVKAGLVKSFSLSNSYRLKPAPRHGLPQ
jgi:putative transposase